MSEKHRRISYPCDTSPSPDLLDGEWLHPCGKWSVSVGFAGGAVEGGCIYFQRGNERILVGCIQPNAAKALLEQLGGYSVTYAPDIDGPPSVAAIQ